MLNTNLSERKIITLLLFISLVALATVYVMEYFFGVHPCILCLYQRIPYFLVAILCISSYMVPSRYLKKFISACFILVVLEALFAFYHVSIEYGWIAETSYCSSTISTSKMSLEEIKRSISSTASSCSKPAILILYLSLAEWNLLLSLFLVWCIYNFYFKEKNEKTSSR